MADLLDSGLLQGALGMLLGVLVLALFGWLKFKRDERIVARFLRDSGIETGDRCRTTDEISSATRLSEVRIRRVCRKSAMIERHGDEEESWRLS